MADKIPHHIIAIGASAGGMDEINSFFDHTHLDGVSYIVIQHLSPDFKSRMVELLARHSKLAVKQAENAETVKSNVVYLIPNDRYMTIKNDTLYLEDKVNIKGPQLTINKFLNSLAENSTEKAIAVILSGLGSDGTEGAKAIKKSGGMVIARKPETSKFPSMPFKAIATGVVDFILEPALMPDTIEDYVKNETKLSDEIKDDEKNLKAIIDLIKLNSPHDFSDYKQITLLRRTKRRAAYSNFSTLRDYLKFLKTSPEEVEILSKDFMISVTSFFRDKQAFHFIQKNIFPVILEKLPPGEELKMWVVGCATGEEVYSLCILIAELLTGDFENTIVKIFATDIDTAALARAGKAVYHADIVKNVSPARLKNYFIKEGNNYRVIPAIRKMAIFAKHDLVKNPPYCNMQFISCRNLLIYMTPLLQKKVFTMLQFGLKRDGFLFLGSSENPTPIVKSLKAVNTNFKLYKNLKTKQEISFDAFLVPEFIDKKPTLAHFYTEDGTKNQSGALAEAMHKSIADELDYLTVCIDENNHVIKSYGNSKKYLLPKHFTTNLIELLPKPLGLAFNTLIKSVLKTTQKDSVSGIIIRSGKTNISVSLTIIPVFIKKDEQNLWILIFNEDQQAEALNQQVIKFDEKLYHKHYTLGLEDEVRDLKDKLQSAYEQLDASNENMQSFNEEMIAANEEMQSTNEEMQSVNEELDTINAEYHAKNKELLEMNDDLNNYFRSNVNGQLFINNDLELMRFSPGTVTLINLMDTDIGRPLSNITANIKLDTIIEDIKKVLTSGQVITKQIEANNGKWYQIMTMPYIQQPDNKRNGAIITFIDITELKNAQTELDQKNSSLQRINADLDHFIHAASHDLLAPLNNIEGSIDIMNSIDLSDEKLFDFLSIINSSIKKFRALITDIATIAKVEGDMIAMEMVDMDEILNNIEWSLEDKIESSGAVIIRDLEVKHILFSKKNLRSIVYNLISNGIKFRREVAPIININTSKTDDHVVLTVEDNGIGMDKRGLSKIFDMYGRLNQDIEGHGIGLYLAKKIVNAANGNLTVESEPGKGSKFIIFFKARAVPETVA